MRALGRASVVLALILAASTQAFAQSGVDGGVQAGVNFATVSGSFDTGVDTSRRTGITFGVFYCFQLSKHIAFEPELMYSPEGAKLRSSTGSQTLDSTAKIDVIEIPLLLRVGRRQGRAFVVAGPAIGIITNARRTDPLGGPDIYFKDDLKRTDVSLVLGAGVNFSKLFLEGRYTAGLVDLNKDSTSIDKIRTQVISFLLGIRFSS